MTQLPPARTPARAFALAPLAHAIALALTAGMAASPASAQNAFSAGWFAAKNAAQSTATQTGRLPNGMPAAALLQQQPSAASLNAQRSIGNLNTAARAIALQQSAQAAGRAAAMAAPSDVPDGLGEGGLKVDTDPLTAGWRDANAPTQTTAGGKTEVTIEQTAEKAILNWQSFNVGKNTTVNFDQKKGEKIDGRNDWIALNRINDPSGKPSQIAGQIKADGTVYLVNRNGIIFNGTSQVNTRGLVASSLALTDAQFDRGINNPESLSHVWAGSAYMPVFGDHSTTAPDPNGAPDWVPTEPVPGHVVVQAGASLNVTEGGKLMLFGTQVRNAGAVNVKDGQIIMAAGEQVWLGEDLNGARGLDVAVSGPLPHLLMQNTIIWTQSKPNWQSSFPVFDIRMRDVVFPALDARAQALGYQVTNTGSIHADRGSITMQSRDVNQNGVVTASTALNNRDGSIRLRAWGQGSVFNTSNAAETYGNFAVNWNAGTLTLGQGSLALILPDPGDTSQIEATDLATRYTPGSIALHGKLVDLQSGSLVMAPSGRIDIVSAANPFQPTGGAVPSTSPGYGAVARDNSRIYLANDAVVSVAGLQEVAVDMARNFIEVDMRINELRDSPLQRDSWLRGQKLTVDRRESGVFENGPMSGVLWGGKVGTWVGTPLADASSWLGVGKTDLQELSTTGGAIRLKAGGSLVTREGSLLDISGGSVRYEGGLNTASKLMGADGRMHTMADAMPDMAYTGIAGRYATRSARWGVSETFVSALFGGPRYEAGYLEGRNAGSLTMYVSTGTVLEGDIAGSVVTGDRQRTGGGAAKAGQWRFGGGGNEERGWLLGHLLISNAPEKLDAAFDVGSKLDSRYVGDTPLDKTTWIDAGLLESSGLGNINLFVGKGFVLDEGTQLTLAPRTEFAVTSSSDTGADIVFAVNGSIRSEGGSVSLFNKHVDGGQLVLGSGARIDVSGRWSNELLDGAGNGDVPTLDGGLISLTAPTVTIDDRAALIVSGGGRAWMQKGKRRLAVGDAGSIRLDGFRGQDIAQLDLEAFAAGSGGQLQLTVDGDLQVGGDPAAQPTAMHLPTQLYGDRGFRSLSIETKGSVDIADGAQIALVPLGWDMSGTGHTTIASGSRLGEVLAPTLLRPEQRLERDGALLDIKASAGTLRLGEGAGIGIDTGGAIKLTAGEMQLMGTLTAPAGAIDVGGTTVTLGETARLLARGAAVLHRDARGLRTGSVLDGGQVSVSARDLVLEAGALIDVSGTEGTVEVARAGGAPAVHAVASNGGSISISGQGLMASTLTGHAGGAGAQGGSLRLQHVPPPGGGNLADQLVQNLCQALGYCTPAAIIGVDFAAVLESWGLPGLPPMVLSQAVFDGLGDASRVGLAVSASAEPGAAPGKPVDFAAMGLTDETLDLFRDYLGVNLRGFMPVNSLLAARPAGFAQGGFATLGLRGSSVELGDVHLSATQSITVDGVLRRAAGEAGDAGLSAPYLALRNSAGGVPGPVADRVGRLDLRAQFIDVQGGASAGSINGPAAIRGFAEAALSADALRFTVDSYAADLTLAPTGSEATLSVDGALTVAAGQVYPATAVNAKIVSGESITVRSQGPTPDAPLSAGGSLTLSAPVIEQQGVLRAPFGAITLDAGERLTLGAGSLTSVSGAGLLLPYGHLLNNEYWSSPFASVDGKGIAQLPDKRVTLTAPVVDFAEGSVVDIRGGGDLYAKEFVPGTGGSHDLLTLQGAFAVVPGHASPVAPAGSTAAPGAGIWLDGGNGLAAGWYTRLPADYAALPGAFLVMPSGARGTFGTQAGVATMADGSVLMAGRQGNALDGSGDARRSYWQVMSSQQLRQYSEYNESSASAFFASDAFKLSRYRLTGVDVVTPRLPGDGGSVVFKAGERLVLDGQLMSMAAQGGQGGLVDIAGQKIAIVGAGQDASDLQSQGYLLVDAGKLSAFGAGSLLVGGVRSGHVLGLGVEVSATDIVVRNTADTALSGTEIVLAASDHVQVDQGSVVRAQGTASASTSDLIVAPQQKAVWLVNDNGTSWDPSDDFSTLVTPASDWGAMVRVSSGGTARVVRESVTTTRGGLVGIGDGAVLSGGASLLIDATRTTELASSAQLSGKAMSVAAGRIGLGGGSEGLVLGAATLAQLANTEQLTLRSYSTIDFHGDVNFGGAGLRAVVLDTAGLTGTRGDVSVEARMLTLLNSSGAETDAGLVSGGGTLRLAADQLVLGAGAKTIDGFAAVELQGRERIVADGKGSLDMASAPLTLDTPLLTGRQGASQRISTTGALRVAGDAAVPATGLENSLGASLSLVGGTVDVQGRIVALGGTVSLSALTGDLVLGAGSLIDVSGFSKDFYDVSAYANAGRIQLAAERGSIAQAAGGTLNLSAHAGGGSAGSLSITTAGAVDLAGRLAAHAGASGKGGAFAIDVLDLPDFGAMGQRLNDAGFSAARAFRVRQGDVAVDGNTTVEDFSLTADEGRVTLTGSIDARSRYGGRIAIAGGGGVTLTSTAQLQAGATHGTLGSGRVTLEASGGQLDLQGGRIDVSGGDGGRVRLRARQTAAHDDIAVAALRTAITGARSAVLEGVAVYEGVGTVGSVKPQAVADAQVFASNRAGIAARLGGLGDGNLTLMSGIEIRSAGDLVLDTDWNLHESFGNGLREGGLTLRAGGNLIVRANLSDGFDVADRSGVLQDAASWDLRLVSGADLAAASALSVRPLGTLAQGSGSLVVGDADHGYVVRTGTGDLDVGAGRDIDLAHAQSVIYTAGRRDSTSWSDFTTVPSRLLISDDYPKTISMQDLPTAAYGVHGGNLRVSAQGDVSSSLGAGGTAQFFGDWLLRLGREERDAETPQPSVVSVDMPFMPGEQSTWFVDYAKFNQGVGALGGGNVSVNAGGNIHDLLVALPTHGRVRGGRTDGEAKTLELRNGGALDVVAGGDIRGGQYYVGRGDGQLRANELAASQRQAAAAPVLALGDAKLGVTTSGDLRLATVADPLLSFMPYLNATNYYIGAYMSGYTDTSAVDLVSIGGNVVLGAPQLLAGRNPGSANFTGVDVYPSKMHITALSGSVSNELGRFNFQSDQYAYNVDWSGLLFMMPSAHTDLRLLADKDVRLGEVVMSRMPPEAMPSPLNPMRDYAWLLRVWMFNQLSTSRDSPVNANTGNNWLVDDHTPSRIYSRTGSIVREVAGEVFAGEQLWVRAGQDVRGLRVNFRNNHRDDVSVIEAGNDVNGMTASNLVNFALDADIEVQGPGSLLISAGRDVYNVNAISVGNIQRWDVNNFPVETSRVEHLPDEGAAIQVMAGLNGRQPDYAAFRSAYLDPARIAAMPDHLVTTMADGTRVPRYLVDAQEERSGGEIKTVQRGLVSYIAELTGESLEPLQAWTRFGSLSPLAQQVFMRRVFQQELREAGRDQNQPGVGGLPLNGGYNRGYAAIDALFPGDAWRGDVLADSMTLRTMFGGDINVFAPGGKLQVASLTESPAAGEGLVTLAGGHVGVFAHDSVTVNRSRLLTFVPEITARGNDMIIWSTEGDVDAGRGAKTVRVPSKPVVATDLNGVTTVTERSDMSGSGIGTVGSGDVDLAAPKGTINAGDAGIRVAGNLNIAALQVLNAENIDVEGEATGLPVVAAVNIGALTNASAAAAQATAAAQDVIQRERAASRQGLPSIFTVRVLGFGNEPAEGSAPMSAPESRSPATAPYDPRSRVQVIGRDGGLIPGRLSQLTERERRLLQQQGR